MSDDPLAFLARPERPASKLLLDRYAVGETLSPDELRRVEETLASDPEARAFVDAARLPSSLRPPSRRAPSTRRWAPIFGVLALAASILLVTTLGPRTAPGTSHDALGAPDLGGPSERTKGALKLELVVRRQDGAVSTVLPDEVLHPGDALRFRVSLPALPQGLSTARFVAIVGVDSAASVSLYAPAAGAPMPALEAASTHLFEGSVILDGTLGPERFIALSCETPIDPPRLIEAATRALAEAQGRVDAMAPLALPCAEDALLIRKAAP